jgi:hypothetical protein
MAVELRRVRIAVAETMTAARVYAAMTGTTASSDGDTATVPVGGSELVFAHRADASGIYGIDVTVDSLEDRTLALAAIGIAVEVFGDHAHATICGLDVSISEEPPTPPVSARARLDHVAVVARDLAVATSAFEAATGVIGEFMGLHPISNGGWEASRIMLGSAMIEVLAPIPGVESALAAMLETRGEGPVALAMPVDDVDATIETLQAQAVRVIRQPPHWMAHPKDAHGVMVQLTPRVNH